MAYYELVMIIRQDITSNDIDNISQNFAKLIEDNEGKIVKTEYWGLKELQYTINNNKKGHYYLFSIQVDNDLLKEIERKISLNENIIRHSIIKVSDIEGYPSIVLENSESEHVKTIDVTSNNKAPAA